MTADSTRSTPMFRGWWAVALLCGLNVFSFVDRLILGSLVEPIRRSFALGDGDIGLLMGPFFVAPYVISAMFLARIADRGDRRRLIAGCGLGWGLATFGSGLAPAFAALLLLRLVVGFCESGLMPAGMSIISDFFPATGRGAALGLYIGAGILGASGASLFGALAIHGAEVFRATSPHLLAALAPWQLVFLAIGAPTIVLSLLLAFTVREPLRLGVHAANAFSIRQVAAELRSNALAYLGIFGSIALFQAMCYGVLSWYPTFLIRSFGMSTPEAALGFGLAGVAGGPAGAFCAAFLMGWLTRRRRPDAASWIGGAFMIAAGPFLFFALFAPTALMSLFILTPGVFFLIGSGAIPPLTAQALAPNRMRAQMTALYTTLSNIVGLGLGPPMIAYLGGCFSESSRPLGSAIVTAYALLLPLCLAGLFIGRVGLRRAVI